MPTVNEPVTIWTGSQGQELTPSNSANIDTEAGLDLLTEAGVNLIIDASTSTTKPVTVWTENDSQ